jgi:hypothetical protein
MVELVQKLSDPPSWVKVQHLLLPVPAPVQSVAVVHSWTCSFPEHTNPPSIVAHAEAALQVAVRFDVVQLGGLPPVIGISAQHT